MGNIVSIRTLSVLNEELQFLCAWIGKMGHLLEGRTPQC